MKIVLKLHSPNGEQIDARIAMPLIWTFLAAFADLLRMTQYLNSNLLLPSFASTCVTLAGSLDRSTGFFDLMQPLMGRLTRATALLNASENLLTTKLCDRMVLPDARLPIQIVHDPDMKELLAFDKKKDLIRCQAQDGSELVSEYLKVLKAMTNIAAVGLVPSIEVDGTSVSFPSISATLFNHGYGTGRSIVSTCRISGLYLVAGEVEVRIAGFRDDRVIRAYLSDAARLAAVACRPPFSAAIQFSEAAYHLPLLPSSGGKVIIERMWDIQEQTEIDFS